MKIKNIILIALLMLTSIITYSQTNYYYYYKGKKKYLTIDKKHVNIVVQNSFSKSTIENIGLKDFDLKDDGFENEKIAKIEFQNEPTDTEYLQKINNLKNNSNIISVSPFFTRGENIPSIGTSNLFYVKLKNSSDIVLLQEIANQKNVTIIKQIPYMQNWYILSVKKSTIENSINISNQFYETGLFEDVDPAFMFNFKNVDGDSVQEGVSTNTQNSYCVNDPFFSQQWNLKGVTNIDIKFCDATLLSKGSNIKVAVVDQGINLNQTDLIGNFTPISYDANSNTPQSVFNTGYWHGTWVAGIIGAVGDNNLHITGVAPLCKIMPVSHNLFAGPINVYPNISAELASGISWAWQNGADVINNSWGDYGGIYTNLHSSMLENAISDAIIFGRNGKGTIVVFASGNSAPSGPVLDYPGSFLPEILTVGAITQDPLRAIWSATEGSGYGYSLDVVAPGNNIPVLYPPTNTTSELVSFQQGTSMAAPHVSGIAALLLSVNPCLSGQQVRDIIEQTTQKVNPTMYNYAMTADKPNGTWNEELGYGLVNAYAAVVMAQAMLSTHLDLYIKDNASDLGVEPNNTSILLWNSPNIWVRNNQDGLPAHQAPKYNQTTPNYVYVKVENKSCFPTTGNEQVQLYYSRPSTSTPTTTSAYFRSSFAPVTGTEWVLIGTENMPILDAGNGKIIEFPWTLPDPIGMYGCTSTTFNTSLLVKIISTSDGNAVAETNNILNNIKNNNNIAGKNLIVIDSNYFAQTIDGNSTESSILIANPYDEIHNFSIEMIKENLEAGKPIYEEAEVSFKMDEVLYNAWERGGKLAENISQTTIAEKNLVNNNNVLIGNISLNPNEIGALKFDFNFLTKELTNKLKYTYHIFQRDLDTNEIVSAASFEINKNLRPVFEAIAPDMEADLNQAIIISSQDINEPAIYNWYDSNGNQIFQGKNLEIANAIAEKYKLEVISTIDGFKDYAEVEVKLKPSVLADIIPNPANENVNISYKLNEAGSAYLMVLGYYGGSNISNNYILDVNANEINLNVSNYQSGFYTVALVVNGQIVDAKTLIKQ